MRDYFEDLWERLPAELSPPDFEVRRSFLLSSVRVGDRVLDLGCGAGVFTSIAVGAGASAVGADIAEAALRRARTAFPDLDFRLVPIDGPLPFEDCSFDVLWASQVIEHVADTARWLSEARRVLVPRGRLLITTPAHGRLAMLLGGVERFSPPLGDQLHLYTARSLRELLEEFGFGGAEIRAGGGWPLLRRVLLTCAER